MEKVRDIYKGDIVSSWESGDSLFIDFPFCTISVPLEMADRLLDELSKLKTASKRKSKKVQKSKMPLWQKEIEGIVADNFIADKMTKEKADLFAKYLIEDDVKLMPPEIIQEFFNIQWGGMIAAVPVFWIIVGAFKMGMVYQAHREDFEGTASK